ncbi:hypothetical protein [Roseibium marinum]|nr:hypothetical protein [Roseibium marinum]
MESTKAPLPDKEILLGFLEKVCNGQEISGSPRLQDFLTYVVTETLEGRGGQIFGKTIAEDVYKRPPSSGIDSSNLVRVDAGRLRRALESYYNGDGAKDAVRFHIDSGQYAVRFETQFDTPPARTGPRRNLLIAATAFLVLLVAGGLVYVFLQTFYPQSGRIVGPAKGLNKTQREVLLNRSPATLEAVDLATQARSLIFPASNPARLTATRGMFERAVELSPNYYGGHAGLAQIVGLQTFLLPPGEERDALIELGYWHAKVALDLSPASPWTQSALGWMEFVRGNIDEARSISGHAIEIDPDDLSVLNFDSLIGIFSGDFNHVVQTANPANFEGQDLRRHVFTVSYAVAKFHLGEYDAALAALNEAASLGGPTSPISYAYLIAAHQRSGEESTARKLLGDFVTSWPNSRLETLLRRLYVHPEDADTLFDALKAAGWKSSDQ